MSKLMELKKELQELRENTLNEFKDVDTTDFDSEKKEEWAKRNELEKLLSQKQYTILKLKHLKNIKLSVKCS